MQFKATSTVSGKRKINIGSDADAKCPPQGAGLQIDENFFVFQVSFDSN